MPFTFSHPALVLPASYLNKKWYSLSALIVGSLAPDFEYFMRMDIKSTYSHTLNGLLWFNLPVGIALLFVYHNIVRNDLIDHLPRFINERCANYKKFNWNNYFLKNWLLVCVCLIIGAASHIFWDSFTHEHAYFVKKLPLLESKISILNIKMKFFKILQHTSSALGALVILYAILQLPRSNKTIALINWNYYLLLAVLSVSIMLFRIASGLRPQQIGTIIVSSISAVLLSMILTPLILKWKFR